MKPVTLSLVVLILFAAAGAFAQPAGFEKVLFPIVIHPLQQTPGEFGTSWVTDVSILNVGTSPAHLAGTYYCFDCHSEQPLQPGVTYSTVPVPAPGNLGGAFLFIDSAAIGQIRFGLRVRDLSREAEGFGTEVPVVRTQSFRADGVSLLGIPNQPSLRLMLRMYALDGVGGEVRVRIYEQQGGVIHLFDQTGDKLVAERTYTLTNVHGSLGPDFQDNYPAYAQVTDLPMPPTPLARIDIVPLTPGMRIWAFASATNNTTQQVTVISPH
jgi:hypothetical protein